MAMLPAVFGGSIFDDFFDDAFAPMFPDAKGRTMMKADVKETDKSYEVDIEMPGFDRNDITIGLNNGYLTVSAKRETSKDDKDKNGRYLRRERYSGSVSRSFYVGDATTQDDIHARYDNGMLTLDIAKKDQPQVENPHTITIEE